MRGQFNSTCGLLYHPCRPKSASWKPEEGNIDSCSWDGVQCNENKGRVIKVGLSSSCLQGSINSSSSFFTLVDLEWLDLSSNDFNEFDLDGVTVSSPIPYSLTNLSSLTFLSLSGCELLVTPSLGNLTELYWLFLAFSNIYGELLVSIGNLRSLEILYLFECKFFKSNSIFTCGTMDLDMFLVNLKHLGELFLLSNKSSLLIKATSGAASHNFLFVGLRSCNVTEMPNFLKYQHHLKLLDLSSNKIHEKVPIWLLDPSIKFFRMIDSSNNLLQGRISRSLANCSSLEFLDLGNNQISDTFPSCNKGQMMSYGKILNILSDISLSSNRFDGEIPTSISNLRGLQILSLANNSLHGHIPSCLGKPTDLESLDLSDNYLSDKIPQQLANQFPTFDHSSFDENSGLCGTPLSKQCETSEAPTNENHMEGSEESVFSGASKWKIILI
ncbi:hypothetical protein CICLE_v10029830mg, partial [Citrus x clementina]